MEIDLSVFLAAVIAEAGGEIRLPFPTFAEIQNGAVQRAVTLDLVDDGATFVLGLTDDVPDDLGGVEE